MRLFTVHVPRAYSAIAFGASLVCMVKAGLQNCLPPSPQEGGREDKGQATFLHGHT